jgi:hypothetical protein
MSNNKVKVERFISLEGSVIGKVYINGVFFSYSLENKDKLIPCGKYKTGEHYGTIWKSKTIQDCVKIKDVPKRKAILIHPANWVLDPIRKKILLKGCFSMGDGYNKEREMVTNTRPTIAKLISKCGYEFDFEVVNKFKDKKKMSIIGVSLASFAVKKIGKKIFNNLKGEAKKAALCKLSSVLSDKFGIKTKKDLEDLPPEVILEIKKEAGRVAVETEKQYTEQTRIINETMRAEGKSDGWIQRSWRPFIGFAFAISFVLLTITLCLILTIAVISGGETLSNLATVLTAVGGLVSMVFGSAAAMLGAIGYGRSKEKIAKIT